MKLQKIKQLFTKLNKNQKGFSLTELIVVSGILGSIATVSAAQISDYLPAARDAQRKANIHQVQTALALYYDDNLEYPASAAREPSARDWQMIKEILEDPEDIYMPEVPLDPLNEDNYTFKYWSNGQTFQISFETEDPEDNSPQIVWGM